MKPFTFQDVKTDLSVLILPMIFLHRIAVLFLERKTSLEVFKEYPEIFYVCVAYIGGNTMYIGIKWTSQFMASVPSLINKCEFILNPSYRLSYTHYFELIE